MIMKNNPINERIQFLASSSFLFFQSHKETENEINTDNRAAQTIK